MTEWNSGGVRFETLEDRKLLAGEPWGDFPQLIGLDDAVSRYPSITGRGQTVAVIDSGIRYTHPALGGGFGPGDKVIAGYDFIDNDTDPIDPDGHGTGVASVIAANEYVFDGDRYRGLAPDANLIALRAGNDRSIERALQWVIEHRTQYNIVAVNMSLGQGSYHDPVSLEPFGDEITSLYNAGVFMSAVAGNGGIANDRGINYPGAHPHVYAVGAIDDNDAIASFSQRNAMLDLLAPGVDLPMPYWDKERSRHVVVAGSGTSFATPHAAGMAALLKQIDPSITPAEIMQILQQTGTSKFDGATGLTFRRLNVDDAIAVALHRVDDDREDNDSTASATAMSLADGFADFDNMRLRGSDEDYFVFDLSRRSDVDVDVSLSGGSATIDLLNGSGGRIGGVGAGGGSFRLDAGRYYLRFSGNANAAIDYSFEVSASLVGPPTVNATYSSVAADADGTAHVAYYDAKRQELWYATRASNGDWSKPRVIDSADGVGQHVSLALDLKGRPAVAYYDARNDDLKYALLHDGEWKIQKVESKGNVGQYASLAFTPKNHAAIAYYSDDRNELRYAELFKQGWTIRTIDSNGNAGRYASLALHPETGMPAIAYVNSTEDSLRYAEMVNSKKWRLATAADSKKGVSHVSLAHDSHGRAIVSYYDANGADLRFAKRSSSGRWSVSTIDSKGSVGKFSRIFAGPASTADVYYYDSSEEAVYRATLSTEGWRASRVATGGGTYLSAAKLFGEELILFRDAKAGTLREVVA